MTLAAVPDDLRRRLSDLFSPMMQSLHSSAGAQFSVQILADPAVNDFIEAHAAVLDSGFATVPMSDAMRRRLQRSDFIFSGMKTFHELNQAFPSLIDENGNRKPFEQFLNDVRAIDSTYNSNYLRAEYNFVQQSAQMAAKWEEFAADGDRYNLQYRTANDDRVRPEHAALHGVTLPPSDPFWAEYYPPNGWNCRCTVVQVRKSKYPATPHDEAMDRGADALQRDTKGMFRFNPGLQQKAVPDYNPYTISRCSNCDIAKGKASLAAFIPDNQVCEACRYLRSCRNFSITPSFHNYKKELRQESQVMEPFDVQSLATGKYYQTKNTFKRAIKHARSIEEADLYARIDSLLEFLVFDHYSELGEVKDLSDPEDAKNVQRKRDRGVTGYNVYTLSVANDQGVLQTWIITTEVVAGEKESVYHVMRKK